jgi:hypothetical protein
MGLCLRLLFDSHWQLAAFPGANAVCITARLTFRYRNVILPQMAPVKCTAPASAEGQVLESFTLLLALDLWCSGTTCCTKVAQLLLCVWLPVGVHAGRPALTTAGE